MIPYLAHTTILLSGLMIFYWLFLRNETFFALNRWTFVLCIALSCFLPAISIPASISLQKSSNKVTDVVKTIIPELIPAEKTIGPANNEVEKVGKTEQIGPLSVKSLKNWSLKSILTAIYIIGVAIFFIIFVLQLIILLTRKYNLSSIKTGKYSIVELVKEQEPYSFMNTIFINPNSYDAETYEQIIEHEKLHIDQAHFIDKLLAECLVILFWFNPLIWLMRSSISKNLEFLTDHSLLKKGMEKESYQMSLLKVSVSTKPFNLTTSYNNSFLKNRIIMMNSKKSSIASLWKYLFILPLFFLSMVSLNAVQDEESLPTASVLLDAQDFESEAKQSDIAIADRTASEKNIALKSDNPRFTKKTLNLDKINAFNIGNRANVVVRQASQQRVVVEGPSDLINKINQEVKNGNWHIKINDRKNNQKHDEYINVILEVTDLKAIGISGEGSVTGEGKFDTEGNNMNIAISGNGNITLDVETRKTNCAISGHGDIVLAGNTEEFSIAVSGSGNINALDLAAEEGHIAVSGSCKIDLNAQKKLKSTVSGYAEIAYTGDPQIDSKASGEAKIERRN